MKKIITVTFNPSIDVTLFLKDINKDKANRVENEEREVGGKGINVSRVLNGFSIENKAFGLAGEANYADFYQMLGKLKENSSFEKISGAVRENITIRSPKDCIKINRQGPDFEKISFDKMCEAAFKEAEEGCIVVIAGSVPNGFCDDNMLEFCNKLKEKNVKIIIDSEWISSDLLKKIHPFMIKPNIHELSILLNREFEGDEDIIKQLRIISKSIADNILISMGSKGMIAMCENEIYNVTVPEIDVKSTVGAGDSTVAGFVAGQMYGMQIEDSLRLACACGTATATLEGTRVTDGALARNYFERTIVTKI